MSSYYARCLGEIESLKMELAEALQENETLRDIERMANREIDTLRNRASKAEEELTQARLKIVFLTAMLDKFEASIEAEDGL